MESGSQDRNLPASERKLKKARDDGQVTRSEDVKHLAVLGAGALAMLMLAPLFFDRLKQTIGSQLTFDAAVVQKTTSMVTRLGDATSVGLAACVTFAAIVIAATVLGSVVCGGWVSSLKPLMPDFSRLSPFKGAANLFSKKKLVTTAKMLLLTTILFTIAAQYLGNGFVEMAMMVLQPSANSITHMSSWLAAGAGLMLLVILLAAMIDVPLQNFLHKGEMKMSHQEFKEENKETDGNPQMKGKMRQRQRELSQKASVNAVPKADFVVMNPTHFAVAIRYDDKTMNAPQVISKGADLLAMKIRDIAKHHDIPVLQSPMLARALYANAELDQDIPSALYTAVAQVLAYVYRLRNALKGAGPMPGDVPQPFVPPELDPLTKIAKAKNTEAAFA
jgi:flagellar biosynthetic protein FlhB